MTYFSVKRIIHKAWQLGVVFALGMIFLIQSVALAQVARVHKIDVGGKQYEPQTLQAFSGDTVQFCNAGIWGRQPYSHEKYNRFGQRKPEDFRMIKKGECFSVELKNSTTRWLKVIVRDAVNPKAKLVINISPAN